MTENSKIIHFMELLTGKALLWATVEWEQGGNVTNTYDQLTARFRTFFDHSPDNRETGEELLSLKQGSRCVADYALKFRTVAARSGWNQPALKTVFRQGLNADIMTELACRDDQLTLDSLIDLAIRLDRLLRSRGPIRSEVEVPVQESPVEPMQLGQTRVSMQERERRRCEHRCSYCGQEKHFVPNAHSSNAPPDGTTPLISNSSQG